LIDYVTSSITQGSSHLLYISFNEDFEGVISYFVVEGKVRRDKKEEHSRNMWRLVGKSSV
jgi:hypothetical protein